jgi:hypothetical protein
MAHARHVEAVVALERGDENWLSMLRDVDALAKAARAAEVWEDLCDEVGAGAAHVLELADRHAPRDAR